MSGGECEPDNTARLIDIQCRREEEELANVRVQRITRWLILAAVAAILLGAAAVLIGASRSRALVLEPLSVPAGMEARGLTGKALSAKLLDKLADFQQRTESLRASDSYADNWQDDITLNLSGSGVSLGGTWRTLKQLLGNETRIAGELTQTPEGALALTTRAGARSGGTHIGTEAELDSLITRAAEGIYQKTQPYRYSIYLYLSKRPADSDDMLLELARSGDETERKWALNGLSNHATKAARAAEGLEYAKAALEIDATFAPALGNAAYSYLMLGEDEAALGTYRKVAAAYRRAGAGDYESTIMRANLLGAQEHVAGRLGDWLSALAAARSRDRLGPGSFNAGLALTSAPLLAMLHEHDGAADAAAKARNGSTKSGPDIDAALAAVAVQTALDHGDGQEAAAAGAALAEAADRWVAASDNAAVDAIWRRIHYWPLAAVGLAAGGRHREANRLFERIPLDCYDCVLARGRAAAYRRDRAAADRWLRVATRRAPSIPMAYLELAKVRAADPAAALELARESHRRGPRWADPLKLWGDLLAAQGDQRGAAARYAQAAGRAPRWGALHVAWGRALWRSGNRNGALAKFRAAAGMDLGAVDRARLRQILAAASRRT